jgi:hypothetical protein
MAFYGPMSMVLKQVYSLPCPHTWILPAEPSSTTKTKHNGLEGNTLKIEKEQNKWKDYQQSLCVTFFQASTQYI